MEQGTIDIIIFSNNQETLGIYKQGLIKGNTFLHFVEKTENGLLKLGNHNFDLIIVDISMPLISEIKFIEELYYLSTSIPIVIVSEYFNETRDMVFGNKISDYISKPLTVEKLNDKIKDILSSTATSDEIDKLSGDTSEDKRKLSVLFEVSKYLN